MLHDFRINFSSTVLTKFRGISAVSAATLYNAEILVTVNSSDSNTLIFRQSDRIQLFNLVLQVTIESSVGWLSLPERSAAKNSDS